MFLLPDDIDNRLTWPLGRANRLAKRGMLPHIVLPDGAIRFDWREIEPLIVRVPARQLAGEKSAEIMEVAQR